MKTTITYKILHNYSLGLLFTEHCFSSPIEVVKFLDYYLNDFDDNYKMCEVYEIKTKTFLGIKVGETAEKLLSWEE